MEEAIYTIDRDVFGDPIAAILQEDGGRKGIYGHPGDVRGIRILDHNQIIKALQGRGYTTIRFLPKEEFDLESAKRNAKRLGITLEHWLQL